MNDLPEVRTAPVGEDRLGRVLRWVILGGWVLWAALAWWSTPRQVDLGQLDRDLAADRVVTWQRADGWGDGTWEFRGRHPEPAPAENGQMFVWTVPTGQTRYVDAIVDVDAVPADRYAEQLAATALPWRADRVLAHRVADSAGLLGVLTGLLWLTMLVAGPPPRRGTRWYWFWLGLLPYGVGMLAWLYREKWRPPADRVNRHTGWLGVAWAIAFGFVIGAAVVGARYLLGGSVVPG